MQAKSILKGFLVLLVIITAAGCSANQCSQKGVQVPIFDGKTFNGWEGDLNWFRIEDEAIVAGTLEKEVPLNFFLANAGIQFRSRRVPHETEVSGYQADMGGESDQYDVVWGSLYDESRRSTMLAIANYEKVLEVLRPDDWNEYVIRCEGNHIQMWLNGYQTVDYIEKDDSIEATGIIGLQIHGGEPSEAWYRNITIIEL
ncbi:MAG: 3-keto-disaccharide hydrolase [Planctomycetota bacterium]|jgi:hypothetical protein